MPVSCSGFSLLCICVCVWGGLSVNVLKKEFHCLKKRVWKTQAVLCILGVKSQEHGNFSHQASLCVISHQEALTDFLSPPPMWSLPASKAPQQASTSWVCVGEGPSFPWEPLPGDDMAPPGRPRRCADVPPALPTYQNQVTTPPMNAVSLSSTRNYTGNLAHFFSRWDINTTASVV